MALDRFVRKKLIITILALVLFALFSSFLTYIFKEQIILLVKWIELHFNFYGLAAVSFVTDLIVSPFPPDVILLVVSKTHLSEDWPIYILILGLISSLAGVCGFKFGKFLLKTKWGSHYLKNLRIKNEKLILKYGYFTVVLATFTPLPFSITCWMAGSMNLKLNKVFLITLLRIPRFYLVYISIIYLDIFN